MKSQKEWEQLLADERAANDIISRLDSEMPTEKTPKKAIAVRKYWASAHAVLMEYMSSLRTPSSMHTPPPVLLLGRLAGLTAELRNGNVPTIVSDAASPGRTRWQGEIEDIANAIHYLDAVEKGLVDDSASTKTVAECYDVTQRTVRRWKNEAPLITRDFPARTDDPQRIEAQMRLSGSIYARFGRGAPDKN